MKKEVLGYIKDFEEGDAVNAFYEHLEGSKNFVSYLLKDISLFPLWSNVLAAEFGVAGKNPSSACVEQVFRKIKHTALSVKLPVRVDVFVQEHLKYLNGKIRQIDDAIVVNLLGRELADRNETSTEMEDSEKIPSSTVHNLKGNILKKSLEILCFVNLVKAKEFTQPGKSKRSWLQDILI